MNLLPAEPEVVHLSGDGLLGPIGYSQVVRPSIAVAARGFSLRLLSLEKAADLADIKRVHTLTDQLAAAGILWRHAPFSEGGSAVSYAQNVARLTQLGRGLKPQLTWVRGFPVYAAAMTLGAPCVFDTRGNWVAQRGGAWLPPARYAASLLEKRYERHAAAVVSLTELAAQDIAHKKSVCIPTCVDADAFTLPQAKPDGLRIGLVGALNTDYLVDDTLKLFQRIRRARGDATLVIISHQAAELEALAKAQGIEALEVHRATHDAMPALLASLHWGFLLLRDGDKAKRGSMPTKLAEFFATGVRPIHHGCNSEVGDWVKNTGSGVTLAHLDAVTLAVRTRQIAATPFEPEVLSAARAIALPHFSLAAGADRYAALFREVLG